MSQHHLCNICLTPLGCTPQTVGSSVIIFRAHPNISPAMYVPPMGQMPRKLDPRNATAQPGYIFFPAPQPGAYMPPPGGYPPPPHAGQQARPGMPPTPIPAHAHPYYHQSPQRKHPFTTSVRSQSDPRWLFSLFNFIVRVGYKIVQHAVPYPIMMPPPPPGPPHGYEQGPAPPVQMGGHA